MAAEQKRSETTSNERGEITPAFDYHAEKKLVRKLDIHIIPLIMLLYLCKG